MHTKAINNIFRYLHRFYRERRRQRDRERERYRERDRKRQRETERDRERQTETDRDRQRIESLFLFI